MKRSIMYLGMLFMLTPCFVEAQKEEFTEKISQEITFENKSSRNTLVLKNMFGSIAVEGYQGDKILLEVDKKITAKNKEDLEFGKQELKLKVAVEGNIVIVHPDAPYIRFDRNKLRFDWCQDYLEPSYQHQMNFKVKVPQNIELNIGTINDGEVLVQNMRGGFLKVGNINGGIQLKNITGTTDLNCINGNVSITYADNPPKNSRYYSLNGDINVSYQNGLSANVSFKSMNGELFTDFDVEKQFVKTTKTSDAGKAKFKYESRPTMQIGNGQVELDFETLNGNVFIKKI